jgi:hypothetical protein
MSAPVSAALPSASSSSCSTADFTRFPTSDIACAVGSTQGVPSNTSDVFKNCCKSASVESFNGPCGYYCLSVQQTVAELQKCFMDGGVKPGSIFCNGNNTATATGKGGASASPTASGKGATGTASAGTKPNGGVAVGVSKMGLGMLGMVFVSAFAGAVL